MEIRLLKYFQGVAEELSFSRAARRLNVAQPALSRAIKELEDDLGTVLLARTRRSVALTPPGAVLLHETGMLLQQMEETVRRVKRTAAGEEGELRLGYIGPPTEPFLGRILREFQRLHPRVSIVLQERTPERVWEMVANGKLSVGLTRPVLAHQALGLKTMLLRREPLWCVLPQGHRLLEGKADAGTRQKRNRRIGEIRWEQLKDEPLVILARREGVGLYEEIMNACKRARFTPKVAHTPSLMSTVLSYVEAGAGVGIMSDSVTGAGQQRPLAFRRLIPTHTVDLVVVWDEQNSPPVSEAFRQLIEHWLKTKRLWVNSLSP